MVAGQAFLLPGFECDGFWVLIFDSPPAKPSAGDPGRRGRAERGECHGEVALPVAVAATGIEGVGIQCPFLPFFYFYFCISVLGASCSLLCSRCVVFALCWVGQHWTGMSEQLCATCLSECVSACGGFSPSNSNQVCICSPGWSGNRSLVWSKSTLEPPPVLGTSERQGP